MKKAKKARTTRPHGGAIVTVRGLDGLFGRLRIEGLSDRERKTLDLPERSAIAQRRLVKDTNDWDGAEHGLAAWWLRIEKARDEKDLDRLRVVAQWLLDRAKGSTRAAEFDALAQEILALAKEERARAPDPATGLRSRTLREFVAGTAPLDRPKAFDGPFIDLVQGDVGTAHLYDLKTRLARAAAFFGETPMHEIDAARAKAFITALQREDGRARLVAVGRDDEGHELTERKDPKKAASTVLRYRAALSRCWGEAIEQRFAAVNPWRAEKGAARSGTRTKALKFTPRFLTPDEVSRILAHLPERFRPMFGLLAATGLRLSEAQALTWPRVRPGMTHIEVENSKSGSGVRTVPCSARAKEILEQRWREHVAVTSGPDLVFTPYERTYLWARWQEACIAAGVGRGVRVHDLRHYFGSSLAQNGTPLSTIARLLGHGTQRMTEIYASHVPHNAAERAIAALDAARGVAPTATGTAGR